MKILKYILIAILVLIVLFFTMGLINSSVTYGHEITVDKPIEEAWAVGQDIEKYDQWLEGFKSIELIDGEWFTEGSKYKVTVNPGDGQPEFEMTETIMTIREPEMLEMHFDSEFMNFEQIMSFSEADGKTTVKTESKVIAKGLVMKSMFAIMETFGGAFTKQETKNIEALKKVINENTKDYFPEPAAAEVIEQSTEES